MNSAYRTISLRRSQVGDLRITSGRSPNASINAETVHTLGAMGKRQHDQRATVALDERDDMGFAVTPDDQVALE